MSASFSSLTSGTQTTVDHTNHFDSDDDDDDVIVTAIVHSTPASSSATFGRPIFPGGPCAAENLQLAIPKPSYKWIMRDLCAGLLACCSRRNRANPYCYIGTLPSYVLQIIADLAYEEAMMKSGFFNGGDIIINTYAVANSWHTTRLGTEGIHAQVYNVYPDQRHAYEINPHVPRHDFVTWDDIGASDPCVLRAIIKEASDGMRELRGVIAVQQKRIEDLERRMENATRPPFPN